MPQSGKKSSAKGRLTSTGLHPMRGVPPPERLVQRYRRIGAARILEDFNLPKEWQAGVSKVESCSLAEYNGGRGLKTIFPDEEDSFRRCTILCTGDTNKLMISLEVAAKHQNPLPRILHQLNLPSNGDRIGIRLYDVDVSIEFREHPRNPKQRKSTRRAEFASGECWVVHLETSLKEQVLVKGKRMLRRLEAVTNSMPPDWFTYRNYLVKQDLGESADNRSVSLADGVFTQSFAGGYTWRFTGNLASKEFQEALNGKAADANGWENMPTRIQPFRTAKGKKAAKKIPGKQRRLERVVQRSIVPDKSHAACEHMEEQEDKAEQLQSSSPASSPSDSEFEPLESDESDVFEIEEAVDANGRKDVPTRVQPFRTAKGKKAAKKVPAKQRRLKRVLQRSIVPDESHAARERMQEQKDKFEQPQPSSSASFPSEAEREPSEPLPPNIFEINGLSDKRIIDGEIEYEVDWSGPYKEKKSWEPAVNVTAESIAEFEKSIVEKEKKDNEKASNIEQSNTSKANVPLTRSASKAAQKLTK